MGAKKDHTKLPVFLKADELVLEVYRATEPMADDGVGGWLRRGGPGSGLRSAIRSAVSGIPLTIMEACRSERRAEYDEVIAMATEDATEARYMVSIAGRLGKIDAYERLLERFDAVIRDLEEETKSA